MIARILKRIGLTVLAVIALCLVLLIIGFIVDLFCSPALKSMATKARSEFASLRPELKENAWDDYSKAADSASLYYESSEVEKYLRGDTVLSPALRKNLIGFTRINQIVKQGNGIKACQIPYNYDEGMMMKLPNYIAMQKLAKILSAQALYALHHNRSEEGLQFITQGMIFSNHIINNAPVLINYMVGIVIYNILLNQLKTGVLDGRFNDEQLSRIQGLLSNAETNLPTLKWAFDAEINMLKSSYSVPRSLGFRVLCWRYIFSPKLALLKSLRTLEQAVLPIAEDEKASAGQPVSSTNRGYEFINDSALIKEARVNPVSATFEVNFGPMLKRKIEMIAKLRALGLSAALWKEKHKTGRFPESLAGLDQNAVCSPLTGKDWNYLAGQDSAVVSSTPFDQPKSNAPIYYILRRRAPAF